jgi:4-hydroxybenzoyl-CoA thioesterase
MPRATLQEQSNYEFQYNTTIHTRDLNYANHLGNDSVVGMLQDARVDLFKSLGYRELDLGDGKTGIIIGDLVVNFKAEGFLFEKLRIDCHINDISDKSFRIFYRIVKAQENTIIALAETGIVAFDYTTRQVAILPSNFVKALKEFGKH